jgi:hypothetical protein
MNPVRGGHQDSLAVKQLISLPLVPSKDIGIGIVLGFFFTDQGHNEPLYHHNSIIDGGSPVYSLNFRVNTYLFPTKG